jgi:P27 family predicted phage terminase small subunit
MRGRPPKSRMQRSIDGEGPPVNPGPPPECPGWLDGDARGEWARIIPDVMRATALSPVDVMNLAAYCQAYSNWRRCELQIREEGQSFVDGRGNIRIHPLAKHAVALLGEMRRISQEFGLSPAARRKMDAPAPAGAEEDGFGAFLRGSSDGTK